MTSTIELKGYALTLIKKIKNDDLIIEEASEVYNTLLDYSMQVHPEYTADEIDKCIYYAMESSIRGVK